MILPTRDRKIINETTNTALRFNETSLHTKNTEKSKEMTANNASRIKDGHSTTPQEAEAQTAAEIKSLLVVVLIPESIAAKCKDTRSTVKFSKKYMSM